MNLSALGSLLESEPRFEMLMTEVRGRRANAKVQVLADAVPFTLATLSGSLGVPTLVITPRPEDARRVYEQLTIWSDTDAAVLHFPETETLPFERLVSDVDTTEQRLEVLSTLADTDGRAPLVVASAAAIVQKTIDRETFVSSSHRLRRGAQVDLDELVDRWRRMGYQLEPTVYAPGFASRRGGILDIYPIGSDLPARIELWGNEIDSIRLFDPETQRSTDIVDSVLVSPARETLPGLADRERLDRQVALMDFANCTEANRDRITHEMGLLTDDHEIEDLQFYSGFFDQGSLLDYMPDDAMLVLYRPTEIAAAAWDTEERAHELRDVKQRRGELPFQFPSSHFQWSEVEERCGRIQRRLEVLPWGAEQLTYGEVHVLPFTSPPVFLGKLDSFVEEVKELTGEGHRVVAVSSHSRRLGEILAGYGVDSDLPDSLADAPPAGTITVLRAEGAGLSDGFALGVNGGRLVVFSDVEIFGVTKQRRTRRRTAARRDEFLSELAPGDYVVHVEHGIGRFMGTGRLSDDEGGGEYLVLHYAHSDKLYVPVDHLDRVTPYVAPMDQPPSLTRLGSLEWKRAKARVARSTREMATELLSLHAARELVDGHATASDSPWQAELEASFPYEETPDQLSTLTDVKADMESERPMDRLVCGDVGYGKTEIALRAAFKTVMDGKQVAVLVPTTVLAQQHYVTFSQRLSPFPTSVEVLSRFRTDQEQREIVESLATGRVDICIGTHRLIQKDVRFKDLGLVIVDEEQRFGVAHKERLKRMREEVDVLTLTATPIPRTLHLSMAGVRDMSTMETPPEERLPIKTYVSEFSDELIREAILRELDRQGQVYFLHNRVHDIDYMADYLQILLPQARIGIAHGQMPENELEQTMIDFADGQMDVLVCTTIIESGLDIPNVNTLIIDRADAFGLAQLYQLRGRVGRSARRAYSYLLIPKAWSLTEAAERRLKAMLAAAELGAGFRIAMKDLEIRGAGNILGVEQSGHIHAVGFDLYTRLLSVAVEDLRARRAAGQPLPGTDGGGLESFAAAVGEGGLDVGGDEAAALLPRHPPVIELGIPASIPQEYIPDLTTRLGIYHRLATLTDLGEVDDIERELADRFGPVPLQAQDLLYVVKLRTQAERADVESIVRQGELIVLRLKDEVGGAKGALQKTLGKSFQVGNTQLRMNVSRTKSGWQGPLTSAVEKLVAFRERVTGLQGAGVG